MNPSTELAAQAAQLRGQMARLRAAVEERVIGQQDVVDELLIGMVAGGHVLLEGLPGLGKTLLARTIAAASGLGYRRIQFTPDLMPADVTGTHVVEEHQGTRSFRFQPGPLFGQLVLADEINRATPRTQSALLEAMQEGAVTLAGERHPLPQPFHVVATQNPIELEGTYPLPEAQLDRFLFKIELRTPPVADLVQVLADTTGTPQEPLQPVMSPEELLACSAMARQVLCGEHLLRWVAELLGATDPTRPDASEDTRRLVRFGASARAGQAIVLGGKARALLAGRPAVEKTDLQACLLAALRHRVVLGYEAAAEGVGVAELLEGWCRSADRAAR